MKFKDDPKVNNYWGEVEEQDKFKQTQFFGLLTTEHYNSDQT